MTSCNASDFKPGKERTRQAYKENRPVFCLQGDFLISRICSSVNFSSLRQLTLDPLLQSFATLK